MPNTKRPPNTQLESATSPPAKRPRKNPTIATASSAEAADEQQKMAVALARWRLLGMPGSEVFYIPNFLEGVTWKGWYEELDGLGTWYHPTLKVYGKEVSQSRSIAAYATSETITVRYSGHQVNLHTKYPEVLTEIQNTVEERLGVKFNHVMLNRYADGNEYIGRHRDTKQNKVIASLSLGAERTFTLTPSKKCPGIPGSHTLALQNGSLLVMQGDTQKNWRHEIPKEPKVKEGRISLTFRQLESD